MNDRWLPWDVIAPCVPPPLSWSESMMLKNAHQKGATIRFVRRGNQRSEPLFNIASLFEWAHSTYQRTPHFAVQFERALARAIERMDAESKQ
jgi:hypothetical protein